MLTPSALLTPSILPPHKISHPQGGLPRPQKELSTSASSCRRYSDWRGTQKMASPRMWCLPSSMRIGQDSECTDSECAAAWESWTSPVWLVGVPPKQAFPQLCLSFPEASAETQLLMHGQWMVPWRGAQPVQARSTLCSYG